MIIFYYIFVVFLLLSRLKSLNTYIRVLNKCRILNIIIYKYIPQSKDNIIILNKKSSDYLKKSFNQKDNLDNTNKIRIQFKIKHITPIIIAINPKLSFFIIFAIIPINVVIIIRNVRLLKSKIKFRIFQNSSGITGPTKTITNSIEIIIIIIIAKIKDIIPNKLCFFISNITLNHILILKQYIKIIQNKKTSDYLQYYWFFFLVLSIPAIAIKIIARHNEPILIDS